MMGELKSEFQLKNLGFSGVSDRSFVIPQARWCFQPATWILYRFAAAIYLTVWWIVILIYWGEPPYYKQADTKAKWFIYVSNWSYLCLGIYFWTSAIGTLVYHKNTKFKVSSTITAGEGLELSPVADSAKDNKIANGYDNHGHLIDADPQKNNSHEDVEKQDSTTGMTENTSSNISLSWNFKVTWLFQNISFTAAFFVTLLFWILDFDPETGTVTVFNLHIHGVNLLFVLVDQFLIGSPYRILHFIHPSIMALVYFIFTAIYYAAGGLNEYAPDEVNGNTYLYKGSLDWERETITTAVVMVGVVFVSAPLLHLVLYGFYRIRRTLERFESCRMSRH
ncbi:uncharacterized protein [Amphiura filiformis]|uniref:uncharacterized protein isoform X2 n=1 Tax=Amphiura filiformis TaxID=82378 RepID=UPI003B210980